MASRLDHSRLTRPEAAKQETAPNGRSYVSFKPLTASRHLKRELQHELHDTRVSSALDLAEARAVQRRHRRVEVHLVEHVEDLPPELQRLHARERERPRQREVVLQTRLVDDRKRRQI